MPSKWNVLTPLVDGFEDELVQLEGQAGRTLSTAEKAKVLQIEREDGPKRRVMYKIQGCGSMNRAADVRACFDALAESASQKSPSKPAAKTGTAAHDAKATLKVHAAKTKRKSGAGKGSKVKRSSSSSSSRKSPGPPGTKQAPGAATAAGASTAVKGAAKKKAKPTSAAAAPTAPAPAAAAPPAAAPPAAAPATTPAAAAPAAAPSPASNGFSISKALGLGIDMLKRAFGAGNTPQQPPQRRVSFPADEDLEDVRVFHTYKS